MPFHVGTTRPSAVGWTRVAVTAITGAVVVVLLAQRIHSPVLLVVVAIAFALYALWAWMHHWTRFIVDEHGVTVSLGGFWPRRPWPLSDFRSVQLREVPASSVGVTAGGYGWRRGRALTPTMEQLRGVGKRRPLTLPDRQATYHLLVTRGGMQVEIIGREGTHFLFSPEDPQAAAEAIDQAIRARS